MDKRSLVLYLSGLAAAGAVVGLAASCSDQPRMKCTAGHGAFAAVYTPKGGTDCDLHGEEIGIEAYNESLPDKSTLDPNNGSLGMEPVALAARIDQHPPDMNGAHSAFSLGKWAGREPGGDEFCTVSNPTNIEQNLEYVPPGQLQPDGGPGTEAVPALNIKYEWSNVRFYNTPAAPGTQLIADLILTRTEGSLDGGAGTPCTAEYKVVGLWPSISCAASPLEDGGAPPDPLDYSKCSPEPDPSKNRPTGSGIGPDLSTRCDENLRLCVLAKDPPSFK